MSHDPLIDLARPEAGPAAPYMVGLTFGLRHVVLALIGQLHRRGTLDDADLVAMQDMLHAVRREELGDDPAARAMAEAVLTSTNAVLLNMTTAAGSDQS